MRQVAEGKLKVGWALLACVLGTVSLAWGQSNTDLQLAHGLYQRGRYQESAQSFEKALKATLSTKDRQEAEFFLAECRLQLGKYALARPAYEAVAKAGTAHPQDELALYRRAQLAYLDNKPDQGRAYFEQFLRQAPKSDRQADAYYYLARIDIQQKKWDDAKAHLDQAVRGKPSKDLGSRILLARAQWAEGTGRRAEAARLYRSLKASSDKALAQQAAWGSAQLAYQQADYDFAKLEFSNFAQKYKDEAQAGLAQLHVGYCLYHQKKFDQAKQHFVRLEQQSKKANDDDLAAQSAYQAGLSAFADKEYAQAEKIFRQAWTAYPDQSATADIALYAGLADVEQADWAGAQEALAKFVTKYGDHAKHDEALYYLSRSALMRNDASAVENAYGQLVKLHPKSQWKDASAALWGEILAGQAKRADRLTQLKQLVAQASDGPAKDRLQFFLAWVYREQGQPAQAEPIARRLLSDSKTIDAVTKAQVGYLLGQAQIDQKQWGAGALRLTDFLTGDPSDALAASATRALGQAWSQLDDGIRTKLHTKLVEGLKASDAGRQRLLEWADVVSRGTRSADAVTAYQAILQGKPTKTVQAECYLGLGWLYLEQKDYSKSAQAFERIDALGAGAGKHRSEAAYLAAFAHQQAGENAKARDQYAEFVKRHADSPRAVDALRRWGALASKMEEQAVSNTLESVTTACKRAGKLGDLYAERAWMALDRGQTKAAVGWFEKVVTDDPKNAQAASAVLKLAELAYADKRPADAQRWAKQLQTRWPKSPLVPSAAFREALSAHAQEQWTTADGLFAQFIKDYPANALVGAAAYWRGQIAQEQQQWADAKTFYDQTLAHKASAQYWPSARLNGARCLLASKKYSQALSQAQKLVDDSTLGKDSSVRRQAYYVMGETYQRQAKFDQARSAYQKIVDDGKRTVTSAKAQFMIGETYFHQKQYDKAIDAFTRVEVLYALPDWQALALVEQGQCHEQAGRANQAKDAYQSVLRRYAKTPAAVQAKRRLALLTQGGSR